MHNRWWAIILLVALVGGGAFASLLRGVARPAPPPAAAPAAPETERISLSVRATPVREDEQTWYALALGLVPAEDLTLHFPTAQRFDFAVYASDGAGDDGSVDGEEPLWRWSAGRVFAQVVGRETYEAGRLQLFVVAWDGTGPEGGPLPPGRYRLVGRITSTPEPLVAEGRIDLP